MRVRKSGKQPKKKKLDDNFINQDGDLSSFLSSGNNKNPVTGQQLNQNEEIKS